MRTSTIKSIAALALTGAGSALVLGFRTTDGSALDTSLPAGSSTGSSTGSTSSDGSTAQSSQSTSETPGSTASGAFADGTYIGAAVSEPWGPFQVEVVISNGTITAVDVVESPSDRHSSSINSRAVALLTESVLASQGESVDAVSGATWTSDSYTTSLQAALDAAAQAA
jgi:uncharacterized protein with FMN-binding domain